MCAQPAGDESPGESKQRNVDCNEASKDTRLVNAWTGSTFAPAFAAASATFLSSIMSIVGVHFAAVWRGFLSLDSRPLKSAGLNEQAFDATQPRIILLKSTNLTVQRR